MRESFAEKKINNNKSSSKSFALLQYSFMRRIKGFYLNTYHNIIGITFLSWFHIEFLEFKFNMIASRHGDIPNALEIRG